MPTNADAIRRWAAMPHQSMEDTKVDGDFSRRHLLNPTILRMLGDVRGRRVLDAGSGNGYLSRMLAARGADVVAVEPADALYEFAVAQPSPGVRHVQADLCDLPDLGGPFDAVVCNVVLVAVPGWVGAMRACLDALAPGGLFVFTIVHPCFENLWSTWREHGEYRTARYFDEYELDLPNGIDFHRPLSSYLNALVECGGQLRQIAEPRLDAHVAGADGVEAYTHLPNFLAVAATKQ